MNSATIVMKRPKLYVPDLLLSTAILKCPTVFGFAGQEKGDLKFEISPKAIGINEIKTLMKAFEDEYLVMYFANFAKAVIPDDIQPWSVSTGGVEDDGTPIHDLAIFYQGDFKNYEGMNGDHTGEYCASDETIFPRLNKAMVDSGGNVEKFYDELRKDNLQKAMKLAYKEFGTFVFLPKVGDPICFGDSKVGGSFDWGTTSNTFGLNLEKVEKEETKTTGLAFLRGNKASVTATPAQEPVTPEPVPEPEPSGGDGQPVKENEQVGVNPAIVGKTPQQLEAAGWKKMFPPAKLTRGKARNLWLRIFNAGKLPPDHESSQCSVWIAPDIIDLAQRVATSKGDVENIQTGIKRRREAAAKASGGDVISEQMKIASQSAEILLSKDKEGEKPVTRSSVREQYVPPGTASANTSPYLPTMSDDEKLKAMLTMDEYFKKDKRPTPLEVQKGESKHATFSQATGYKFTDLLFLPVEQVYKLFDGNKIAVAAFIEMRRNYIESSGINLETLASPGKKEEVQEVNDRTKPNTSVPEVPVKQVSGLAFLRSKNVA